MEVTALSEEERGAALALLEAAQLPTGGLDHPGGWYVGVREEGRLVGLCGLERYREDGLLRSLVVAPARRGTGLGDALVRAVLARAREERLGAVYLLTTTARDYFVRLGFSVCPRESAPPGIQGSWEFRHGCPTTAVFMRLPLHG